MDLHLDRVSNIPVTGWALVVAGAAFGGAVLGTNRILGAAIVGGLALAYEISQAPCCAGCAQGAGCGATATTATSSVPIGPVTGLAEQTASGVPATQQQVSTAPLSNDYVGSQDNAPFDAGSVFAPATSSGSPLTATRACAGCS